MSAMRKLLYVGPPIVLWDNRLIHEQTEVEVTDEQAEELLARDPENWKDAGVMPEEV